jgi:hypothetical protein
VSVVFRNDAYNLKELLLPHRVANTATRHQNSNDLLLQQNTSTTDSDMVDDDDDKHNSSLQSANSDVVDDEASIQSDDEEEEPKRSNTNDITKGTRVDMPLWLARELGKKHFVTLDFPKWTKALENCDAEWSAVNMNSINPYYYEFGHDLAAFIYEYNAFSEERRGTAEKLQDYVVKAFTKRFSTILYTSSNMSSKENITAQTRNLCLNEDKLFRLGQKGIQEYNKWRTELVGKSIIKISEAHKHRETANAQPKKTQSRPEDSSDSVSQPRKRMKLSDGSSHTSK